jgi:hypothetical protein
MDDVRLMLANQRPRLRLDRLDLLLQRLLDSRFILDTGLIDPLKQLHLGRRGIEFWEKQSTRPPGIRTALNALPPLLPQHTIVLVNLQQNPISPFGKEMDIGDGSGTPLVW